MYGCLAPSCSLSAWHHCTVDPQVMRKDEIPAMKWQPPDEDGLVTFLVSEKGFNEDRVRKVVERIRGSRGKSNQGTALGSMPCLNDTQYRPEALQVGGEHVVQSVMKFEVN